MQIRPPCSLGGGLRERDLLSLVQRRRRKRERERDREREGREAGPIPSWGPGGRAGPGRRGPGNRFAKGSSASPSSRLAIIISHSNIQKKKRICGKIQVQSAQNLGIQMQSKEMCMTA